MNPINNNQPTPLEKLISEKEQVRTKCRRQEEKLNDDFNYIQQNSGSLLLSGLSSLLFPTRKSELSTGTEKTESPAEAPTIALGLSDYLSVAKGMLPVVWDIVRPVLITWGITRARSLFSKILHRK